MIVRQCDLAQISLLLQDAVATATDPSLNPPPPVVEASNGFVWSHAQVLAMRVGEVGVGGHQRSPLCLSCPKDGALHYTNTTHRERLAPRRTEGWMLNRAKTGQQCVHLMGPVQTK